MQDFGIDRAESPQQVTLALSGDLDLYSAPQLDDALVLDLRRLEFIDSMALRLVMRTQARAEQDGRRMVVVRGPAFLDRVLTLSGLTQHLSIVDEPPAAAA